VEYISVRLTPLTKKHTLRCKHRSFLFFVLEKSAYVRRYSDMYCTLILFTVRRRPRLLSCDDRPYSGVRELRGLIFYHDRSSRPTPGVGQEWEDPGQTGSPPRRAAVSAQGKGSGWGIHSNPPTLSQKLIHVRLHDGTRALDTCGGARGKAAKHGLIGSRPIASDRRQLHVESDAAEG
jgi:hypothetical protein